MASRDVAVASPKKNLKIFRGRSVIVRIVLIRPPTPSFKEVNGGTGYCRAFLWLQACESQDLKLQTDVMVKHGVRIDGEDDGDDEDWRFWDASFELMSMAEAHWKLAVLKATGR